MLMMLMDQNSIIVLAIDQISLNSISYLSENKSMDPLKTTRALFLA